MKDVVNFPLIGEFQLKDHVRNLFEDSEGSIPFGG
jgi:hypothetical protein